MSKVFISHSSSDAEIAELLVDLIRSSLHLSAEEIRCTSVDGYRLPGGADVDEQLREELLGTPAFIGLISKASFESVYVLFELGARWGAQKHLVPLLAPGVNSSTLQGPIAGLNALSCDSSSQLHQLVHDVAGELGIDPEQPAVYQKNIERILSLVVKAAGGESPPRPHAPMAHASHSEVDDYENAEEIIRAYCEKQWPDDFRMRAYCEEQQRKALTQLKRGAPEDIPEDLSRQIRAKCVSEWPTDFKMRHYCEERQIDAYRDLQRRN